MAESAPPDAARSSEPGDAVEADADRFAIRINVAGPAYTGVDYPGSWAADPGAGGICGGNQFDSPTPTINGTSDSPLFVNQMFATNLTCTIGGVPAGTYSVKLLFAELRLGGAPCTGPVGQDRIFDIEIEGTTVMPALDVTSFGGGCAAQGGSGHAFGVSFTVDVLDGTFDLAENASMGAAAINAIELVQQ